MVIVLGSKGLSSERFSEVSVTAASLKAAVDTRIAALKTMKAEGSVDRVQMFASSHSWVFSGFFNPLTNNLWISAAVDLCHVTVFEECIVSSLNVISFTIKIPPNHPAV